MPNKASPSLISPVANDIKLHGRSTAPAPSIGRASIIQIIIEKINGYGQLNFKNDNILNEISNSKKQIVISII